MNDLGIINNMRRMQLVFIHGWGFDTSLWDALAPHLTEFNQRRVDLGFFGPSSDTIDKHEPAILVGHSLGFVYGMTRRHNWQGWIAINSFPRFVATTDKLGCVSEASLRRMKQNVLLDPVKTLSEFYVRLGATPPAMLATAAKDKLASGLDVLRDTDIGKELTASSVPGLVLASANDPLVPLATSQNMMGSHIETLIHPDGGHMLPQTASDWCAETIKSFIASKNNM
jgi:pimeloyl-[acyl-carrier protein] methyl ester esterase